MTISDRSRIHPVTAHAYTLPIVREVLICTGQESGTVTSEPLAQPLPYPADAHAW